MKQKVTRESVIKTLVCMKFWLGMNVFEWSTGTGVLIWDEKLHKFSVLTLRSYVI